MSHHLPKLITLLQWADEIGDEGPCAECQAWLAASPDAQDRWRLVIDARETLNGGIESGDERVLSAEDVAAYVDGRLDDESASLLEETCWRSRSQMVELLSAARHGRQPPGDLVESPPISARLH